jgi:hypothetical protein
MKTEERYEIATLMYLKLRYDIFASFVSVEILTEVFKTKILTF